MSEPIVAAEVAEVTPIGELNSLSEYRERRAETEPVEAVEAEPVAEPKVEAEAVEPDAASEAGKALAAKRGSLQARIDEVTREKHEAAREAAALKAEIAALKAGKAQPVAAQASDPNDPEPDIKDFADKPYEAFTKAQARWEARQELRDYHAKLTAETQQRNTSTRQSEVEAAAKAAFPDFDDAIKEFVAGGNSFSPLVADVVLHHPIGHEVAYALAKDPAANARINAAPNAVIAGIEMGRFIAGLEGKPKAEAAPVVTKAPAPVKPLGGGAAPAATNPANINSVAEWRRQRSKFE